MERAAFFKIRLTDDVDDSWAGDQRQQKQTDRYFS
jgi:hypothetical protein